MEYRASFASLLRQAAGLTQDALAERAHLSARTLSDLERGVSLRPRLDSLVLLGDALAPADRAQFEEAARRVVRTQDATTAPPPRSNLPRALSSFMVHSHAHTVRLAYRVPQSRRRYLG